jgi:hypothetical protein
MDSRYMIGWEDFLDAVTVCLDSVPRDLDAVTVCHGFSHSYEICYIEKWYEK